MKRNRIEVQSSARTYPVVCGQQLLQQASKELAKAGEFSSVHVLSSPKVWRAVGGKLTAAFGAAFGPGRNRGKSPDRRPYRLHLFDDAERRKNLQTVEQLARQLSQAGADRRSLLLAVGGGVVGDVAGYVAASYLRGVPLVHVPTTLVAQVDSSIGGKTGVNLPEGKNLVGAFYPPVMVLTDWQLLGTLPEREYRGGLAEVIKHAVIADAKLFAWLEVNFEKVLRRDRTALGWLIPRNVKIKARVVSQDERESGLRETLNFGHTFAHALESLTRYRRFQHGEAVAWGMMAAALLGHEAGITRARHVERIVALVRRLGPLPAWPSVGPERFLLAMRADKKARSGKLRFVLTPEIGQARSYDWIADQLVKKVLQFAPRLENSSNASGFAAWSGTAGYD
jgi:3-dehydroquinate synthase